MQVRPNYLSFGSNFGSFYRCLEKTPSGKLAIRQTIFNKKSAQADGASNGLALVSAVGNSPSFWDVVENAQRRGLLEAAITGFDDGAL